MDPRHSNVGEGSQGFQPITPNVPMKNPSGYAPEGFEPAEIPEASNQNSEAGVEEVAAPTARTGKRRNKNSGTRIKLCNFNADEDANLVNSWLEISCDTSTGQKRHRMWERIVTRYNSRRASNPKRSVKSLQGRWDKIKAQVPMMNPSGYAPEGFQPAEIPEASNHNSEASVEEVAAPTARKGKRRNKNSGTRTKLSNFNADEDVNLVNSWLEISCNPITSTGQKRDRMWERIVTRYNSRRASNPERSVKSLQCRWVRIEAEVGLFASFYADSIRENPSGMSDACKTTHAVDNFASVHKRKFGFLHCWKLMKDEPKWQDPNVTDVATAAQGEGFGDENTQGPDTVDNADGRSSPVRSGAQAKRPMGRDSAKAAKQKANSDAGSTCSAGFSMDPSHSNVGEGSQGFQPIAPNVPMMNPSGYAPEGFQPAEIPEASNHNSEAGVEEMAAPTALTGQRRNKSSGTRTQLGNVNVDEDVNLVRSWLEISCEPITSTGQKRDRMWERIVDNAEGRSIPVRPGGQARRSMGRDSAKAAKKKANSNAGSASSAKYAARMQDLSLQKIAIMQEEAARKNDRFQQLASIDERRFEEMCRHNESLIRIEQEKIRLMREKQEDERLKEERKEDERILKIDLDACKPSLRLYYQTLQEEILEKIAARRRSSQAP